MLLTRKEVLRYRYNRYRRRYTGRFAVYLVPGIQQQCYRSHAGLGCDGECRKCMLIGFWRFRYCFTRRPWAWEGIRGSITYEYRYLCRTRYYTRCGCTTVSVNLRNIKLSIFNTKWSLNSRTCAVIFQQHAARDGHGEQSLKPSSVPRPFC